MRKFLLIFYCLISISGLAEDMKRVVDLRGQWKFSIGDNPEWSSPQYDDRSWESIYVPTPWENEGFSGFDGYAWYRTTVDLRNITDLNLYLVLGYIDDVDQVYLNGKLIGFSGSFPPDFYTAYDSERKYYIPPDIINRNGKNVIAVRVYDTVLEGGIIKGNIGIYSNQQEPNSALLLDGMWKFREGYNKWWKEQEYDDSHWRTILVPGFWRSLKKVEFEGEAWYRKEFVLPQNLKNETNLVLVLGYIDDFDETYFNGVLVGRTNDGKHFGLSNSYQKLRVYPIPANLINKTGENVIAVRVLDIGGNAGIYEGPLALVPERAHKKLLEAYNH